MTRPVPVIASEVPPRSKPSSIGFKAGEPDGHHLVNRSHEDVVYLEIGDRLAGDSGNYPDDDLKAVMGSDGRWKFLHKDGSPY